MGQFVSLAGGACQNFRSSILNRFQFGQKIRKVETLYIHIYMDWICTMGISVCNVGPKMAVTEKSRQKTGFCNLEPPSRLPDAPQKFGKDFEVQQNE